MLKFLRLQTVPEFAFVAMKKWSRNVEKSKFTIGHIKACKTAIIGGKMKLNGIDSGKIGFRLSGRKYLNVTPESGEKHIADIYNPIKDLVIEFQNSPIKGQEIQAREKYYTRMLWLLNGSQLSFSTMPVDAWNEDFARLEARIKAKFLKDYREEKVKLDDQIRTIQKESQVIDDLLTRKKITEIDWLRKSNRIDKQVAILREEIDQKKMDAERLAKKELEIGGQHSSENLKREYENRYVVYDWRYKNPSWNDASHPIFVDHENELFLLKSKYVAVAVPIGSFLTKYGSVIP